LLSKKKLNKSSGLKDEIDGLRKRRKGGEVRGPWSFND